MVSYDIPFRLEILESHILEIESLLNEVREAFSEQDSLYDNSDMIRYFKVSERTLANCRAMGLISYSKIGSKIYYTKEDRDRFLENHKVYSDECYINEEGRVW